MYVCINEVALCRCLLDDLRYPACMLDDHPSTGLGHVYTCIYT